MLYRTKYEIIPNTIGMQDSGQTYTPNGQARLGIDIPLLGKEDLVGQTPPLSHPHTNDTLEGRVAPRKAWGVCQYHEREKDVAQLVQLPNGDEGTWIQPLRFAMATSELRDIYDGYEVDRIQPPTFCNGIQ